MESEPITWWNYGIAYEGDLNGDVVMDYAWYGGDDTGHEMLLFLSSKNSYRRVDIIETVEAVWKDRFETDETPELNNVDSYLANIYLERLSSELVLVVNIETGRSFGSVKQSYGFRIKEAEFKPRQSGEFPIQQENNRR